MRSSSYVSRDKGAAATALALAVSIAVVALVAGIGTLPSVLEDHIGLEHTRLERRYERISSDAVHAFTEISYP